MASQAGRRAAGGFEKKRRLLLEARQRKRRKRAAQLAEGFAAGLQVSSFDLLQCSTDERAPDLPSLDVVHHKQDRKQQSRDRRDQEGQVFHPCSMLESWIRQGPASLDGAELRGKGLELWGRLPSSLRARGAKTLACERQWGAGFESPGQFPFGESNLSSRARFYAQPRRIVRLSTNLAT
jgi:hypothetical protein